MNNPNENGAAYLSDLAAETEITLVSEPESILSHAHRYSKAGTIRPGIKVPYKSGNNVLTTKEKALYERRMKERVPPYLIEKELGKGLRMTNTPYFSIYPSECANPDSAEQIKTVYSDENGKVTRLKIVFVSDKWWEYMPHNLAAYKASGCFCSSELIDGKLIASRDPENGTASTKHQFPCVPKKCPIYQKKDCKLSGILKFMILGIPGTGLWQLPTHSEISLTEIFSDLKRLNDKLKKMGRSIIGLTFELFKQEAFLSRWDEEVKRKVRKKQWLIRINCPDFPMSDLIVEEAVLKLNPSDTVQQTSVNTFPRETVSPQEVEKTITHTSVEPSKSEEKRSQTDQVTDTTQSISESLIPLLEPIGVVPILIVDNFIASAQKTQFFDLSIEEAKQLEQIVKNEEERIKTQNHQNISSKLPTMKIPTKKVITEPVASLF